jgi:hypothetical protein
MGRPSGTHPTSVTDGAAWKEPSRATIMKAINTRRWPSIEMQERPDRYKWIPAEATEPREREKDSG